MEGKNQYDELLLKFFTGQLNAGEEAILFKWIEADASNRKYFEELESLWSLTAIGQTLTRVNIDEEWNKLKQAVQLGNGEQKQPEPFGDTTKRKGAIYRLIIATSIAASVLIVVGLGWKLMSNANSNEPNSVTAKGDSNKSKDSLLSVVRHEVNTSGQTKSLLLQDGSEIILSDKSEVSFQEQFTSNQRNITLIGKAYFKVAKDKTKPFTVISGEISTTALGTEFTVTAFENANQITVRLYEGKVVIKPVSNRNLKLKKDVYLLPGQEFVYESKSINPKVKNFKFNEGVAPEQVLSEELSRDFPSIPNSKGSWYMFNNQSLAEVFGLLQEMYNVKIVYNKEDVRNIYFTGQFDRADSVEIILKQISILNNHIITKKEDKFIVTK